MSEYKTTNTTLHTATNLLYSPLPAMLTAALLAVIYLVSLQEPSPPSLYIAMADAISNAGYQLPETIPHYTTDGLPFAYPPFAFYIIAAVHDLTGLDYRWITTGLAILYTIAYAGVSYQLGLELLDDQRQALVASVLVAATPGVFFNHIIPSGSVRALAYLLLLAGLITGYRLFTEGGREWLAASGLLFGLVILTHPTYPVFYGLSYLLMYVSFDRTTDGLARGSGVVAIGLLVASPWLVHVATTHGLDILLAAASTHGGVGTVGRALPISIPLRQTSKIFTLAGSRAATLTVWYATSLGALYLVAKRRVFLVLWLAVPSLVMYRPRFGYLAEAFIVAVFLVEGVAPMLRREAATDRLADLLPRVLVAGVLVVSVVTGSLYMAGVFKAVYQGGDVLSSGGYSDENIETANWIQQNTAADATLFATAFTEEVPFYAQREVVNVPWGAEWEGQAAFKRQKAMTSASWRCGSADCLSSVFTEYNVAPDYVYINAGSSLARSLKASDAYQLVHRGEDAAVFRVEGD